MIDINWLLILHEYFAEFISWHAIDSSHKAVQVHILEFSAKHLRNQQVAVK